MGCASLLAGLLSACGSSAPASTANAAVHGGSTQTAISVAAEDLPTSTDYDPRDALSEQTSPIISESLAGTLFGYEGKGIDPNTSKTKTAPRPELATSATASADGRTWTVHLRGHVRSQWGNTLTAQDVVWTIDRALATKANAYNLLTNTIDLSRHHPVVATGPLTVQFHLATPTSVFEQTLSLPWLGIYDERAVTAHSPASDPHGYKWLATHSASFGPYVVSRDELPSKIVLAANPHYWQGPPQIRQASFVQIADDSTRLEAVLSGQVDVAESLAPTDLKTIDSSSVARPYIQPDAEVEELAAFNVHDPAVSDPTVRRAISLAINRHEIAETAFNGLADTVTGCMPDLLYTSESNDDAMGTADVTQAKALLAKAPGRHAVSIGYVTANVGMALPEIIRANLDAAGITTTLKPYSSYSTWATDMAHGVFDIGLSGFNPFINSPGYFLVNLLTSNAVSNIGGFRSAKFDRDAAAALADTGTAQVSATAAACQVSEAQAPMAPLVSVAQLAAVGPRVKSVAGYEYGLLLDNMSVS